MIKCDLQPMEEYGTVAPGESKKTKYGRYHGSMFWDIPGFSSKKWVIATKIKVLEHLDEFLTDEDIIKGCIEYINTPPPRKKFQRRIRNPKYGKFELYKAKIKRQSDEILITALLITDKRKNKHFWGKGFVT